VVYTDPRHGRWILPLIIVGMVVLTYTFVNSIEPAESPSGTVPQDPPFPTTPTEPTTTLPEDVAAFMVTLDIFENQARTFLEEVIRVNFRWEERASTGVTFAETRTGFLTLQTQLRTWDSEVAQAPNVPPDLEEGHVALIVQVGDLPLKMDDIILGLEAPDDGTARRAAVAEFEVEIEQVLEAIEAIRRMARGETDTTTTTAPDDGDTTTTEGPEG
jgi:hypothetical protein